MKQRLIFIIFIITIRPLSADQATEEFRLLKTWGLQFNAQGELQFRSQQIDALPYQRWQPVVKKIQPIEDITHTHTDIDPLVISAKPQQ